MSACPRPAACGIVSNKSRLKKKKVKKYILYSKKIVDPSAT